MKFNIKSRKGFTLIELLVVIGILAVLAAIAIPSVAGLIDRANVSADKTNSNEMTNAIERFASEYELYCQDIASGTLDPDNLDSAQGRVKNVVGVTTRAGIEDLEIGQGETVADDVVAIYRDTKYPVNATTMKKVVENYTKTSSSTFEPKQSDMHYWYSPDCGVVVVAEQTKTAAELDKYVISGMDAKGNDITSDGVNAQWIDLTLGAALSGGSASLPEKGKTLEQYSWEEVRDIIAAGKAEEYGFVVGQTKTLKVDTCDTEWDEVSSKITIFPQQTRTATIIGLDHDGSNTATFMIVSSDGIGGHIVNSNNKNIGGWKDSEMREWLNSDIYNSMSNKDCIKSINKMTNNTGQQGTTATSTSDKVFLLSVKEAGVADNIWDWYPEEHKPVLETEGTTYTWFESNTVNNKFWLRSPISDDYSAFFCYNNADIDGNSSFLVNTVCPAFVVG